MYAGQRPIVLHADLHGGNLKWHRGRLAVFDLDDAGFGVPALDLAISTFYLRAGAPGVEEALRQGYAEVRDLPDVSDEQFEALVAARQLLLANSLLASSTASLRARGHRLPRRHGAAAARVAGQRALHAGPRGRITASQRLRSPRYP